MASVGGSAGINAVTVSTYARKRERCETGHGTHDRLARQRGPRGATLRRDVPGSTHVRPKQLLLTKATHPCPPPCWYTPPAMFSASEMCDTQHEAEAADTMASNEQRRGDAAYRNRRTGLIGSCWQRSVVSGCRASTSFLRGWVHERWCETEGDTQGLHSFVQRGDAAVGGCHTRK